MKALWALFILGQILNAGNMNYQQEIGLYEVNHFIYGEHPSRNEIYRIKALECAGLYGATKIFPKHAKSILSFANGVAWGVMYFDYNNQRYSGVEFKFRW